LTLTQELFSEQDPRFLEELGKLRSLRALASFADKWKKDPRPWAREQLIQYLDQPMNKPGHHPIIKRIFKHAQDGNDNELMALFMVAFDRSVRRVRRVRNFFDFENSRRISEEILITPRNGIRPKQTRTIRDPWSGKKREVPERTGPESRLFSVHTRRYMTRRAWRYFRRLGFGSPQAYIPALIVALKRYTDQDFASGENILDNWSLMNALYFGHEALEFKAHKVSLRENRSISDLSPAPRFPDLWSEPAAYGALFSLILEARSKLVRQWAMECLKKWHIQALDQLSADELLGLIGHDNSDVRDFGAQLLESSDKLKRAPVDLWLRLTKTTDPNVIAIICDLMKRHVSPERLTLEEMIDLAVSRPAPVANMGLEFLHERKIEREKDGKSLPRLAQAQCEAHGAQIAEFALSFYESDKDYDLDAVSEFFDSPLPSVRNRAWQWMGDCPRAHWDPLLWMRLLETPYPDLRVLITQGMEQFRERSFPLVAPSDLERLWVESLMDIHGGAARRPGIIRRMVNEIQRDHNLADRFLPLLVFAARSVRAPEKRSGLWAMVTLAERDQELRKKIIELAPELRLDCGGDAA
jgi:hypothetical protein